ncbi:MAG: hypothetical protein MJ231_08995 [bacterium]|nr:hypothetical protein [bacterium]
MSARSAISEFGRLQDIANVVILDSLIKKKEGAKTSSSKESNTETETTKKETKKEFFTTRKRIIISIVIAVPIVLFFGSALVRGIASSVQESSIDIKLKDSQPPDEYVNLAQDYLLKKYNKHFNYDKNTSYYFEGTYSKSIDCYYTDEDNNLFMVSGKLSNEEDNMVFTDNYQTNMYSHQLRDEITGTYTGLSGAYPPAP